jgi:hypothetical protein
MDINNLKMFKYPGITLMSKNEVHDETRKRKNSVHKFQSAEKFL